MFSIDKCRKILGKKYESLSEIEIEEILKFLYLVAEIEIDYLQRRKEGE